MRRNSASSTVQFLDENPSVLSMLGIPDLSRHWSEVGRGAMGVVFELADGSVAKVTDASDEAYAASLLGGKAPFFPVVHGIYALGGTKYTTYYAIHREDLVPQYDLERRWDEAMRACGIAGWMSVFGVVEALSTENNPMRGIERQTFECVRRSSDPLVANLANTLVALGTWSKEHRVYASDAHAKNWGLRKSTGELVLFDLGFVYIRNQAVLPGEAVPVRGVADAAR